MKSLLSTCLRILLCVLLAGLAFGACDATEHTIPSLTAQGASTGPAGVVDTAPSPRDWTQVLTATRQGSTCGVSGRFKGLEARAMDLLGGVVQTIDAKLPDAEAALAGLADYIDAIRPEANRLSPQLRRMRERLGKRERVTYRRAVERRFRDQLSAYERSVAAFERCATDAQLLELNALMKALSGALQTGL